MHPNPKPTYKSSAPKKPTNLSINSELLAEARHLKINLSAALEQALEKEVLAARRDKWLAENREAIESYNELVNRHGVFGDGLRSF